MQALSEAESSKALTKKVLTAKKISMGRNINFNFLAEKGFSFGQKIRNLGWEHFGSLHKPTYPDLVREFYMNTRLGENRIISTIKNTVIKVNPQTLFDRLKIPVAKQSIEVSSREESLIVGLLLLKRITFVETSLLK